MSQKVGDNSTAVQAARDVNIGMSYSEVKDLVQTLFELNFPKLAESAAAKAKENLDTFTKELEAKLVENHSRIDFNKFAEPNTQYLLNQSIRNYAKKGSKVRIEHLTEALIASLQKDSTELLEIVSEQAIDVIPKLTPECITILCVVQYILYMKLMHVTKPSQLELMHGSMAAQLNVTKGFSQSLLGYLVSLGAISVNQFQGIDPYAAIFEQYKGQFLTTDVGALKLDIESNCPNYRSIISYYEDNNLRIIQITPLGTLIALINLKLILGPMDYGIWIK